MPPIRLSPACVPLWLLFLAQSAYGQTAPASEAAPAPVTAPAPSTVTTPAAATAPANSAPQRGATPTRFSIELLANGCPTTDDSLTASILARVPTAQRAAAGEPADVTFHVEISNGGQSSLLVTLAEGSSRREFRDASCDEAAAIIAFIAALVLDARPGERLLATELAGVPAPTAEAKPPLEPKSKPPKPQAPAAPAPREHAVGVDTERHSSWPSFVVSAAGGIETAVSKTPPIVGAFGLGARWLRPSWLSPELRAELVVSSTSTMDVKAATAIGTLALHLVAGRLSACPLRITKLDVGLGLVACATFDAGTLYGEGTWQDPNVTGGKTHIGWYAPGISLRGQLALGKSFGLELSVGAKFLANTNTFTVNPGALPAYAVPPISGGFTLGFDWFP